MTNVRRKEPVLFSILLGVVGAYPSSAQTLLSSQSPEGAGAPPQRSEQLPLSAWEVVSRVDYEQRKAQSRTSVEQLEDPADSLHAVAARMARQGLARLGDHARTGFQHEAYARLLVLADRDADAEREIGIRLASPELSRDDQASTLAFAVQLFADAARPSRLSIAERYLEQLALLPGKGTGIAARHLEAECDLIRTYADLNRHADVARHARAAVALLPQVPFVYRGQLAESDPGAGGVYPLIVDAVMQLAKGRETLDTLNAAVRQSLVAPSDSAAMDPQFLWAQQRMQSKFDEFLAVSRMVGAQAPAVTSNYWINADDTTAHALRMNDGKVRLLEFGSFHCGPCVLMFSALQRIRDAVGAPVEPVIVTQTDGYWGTRMVSAEEESAHLKAYFVGDRHVRYPIALYRLPKLTTPDGAQLPDYAADPNSRSYGLVGKPTTYLIDGQGTIRRVFIGYSRDLEAEILRTVQHLLVPSSSESTHPR